MQEAALTVSLLAVAAVGDVAMRRVPDTACILLAVLGLALRLQLGLVAMALSLAVALGVFVALVVLFHFGVFGGGDVKLASAVALGLAPTQVADFLFWTALFGGVLGVVYLLLSKAVPRLALPPRRSLPTRLLAMELRRIRRRGPLPYAVAIAAGAAFVMLADMGA